MKILTIGPSGSFGGLQTHFKLLNAFLVDEGHSVFQCLVQTQRSTRSDAISLKDVSGKIFVLSPLSSPHGKIMAIPQLLRLIYEARKFRPDMIIASSMGLRYVLIGAFAPGATIKFYQEVIGDIPIHDELRRKMSVAYGNVACQSERLVDSVRSAVRPLPCIGILPCFSNLVGERFTCRSMMPAQNEPIRFGSFGRLAENKGLIQMVTAFCSTECYSDSELHIYGNGPMLNRLVALKSDVDTKGKVVIHGAYHDDEQLASIMSSMHGMVIASQFKEGLPLVILEAMSVGLPFLATNVCGLPDAASGNADCVLCNPDEGSIRAGFESLYSGLRLGNFDNTRLCSFYRKKFHSSVVKEQWRNFLRSPSSFFESKSPL